MKKNNIILLLILILLIIIISILLYYSFNIKNNSNSSNYNATKLSKSENISNDTNTSFDDISSDDSRNETKEIEHTPIETEIASFTTKIRTKDNDRQTNISLTCSTLNNTTVDNGSTFSFCDTVGKATSNKGYKEASVFQNGEEIEALGGGKCQVSSTLYNAVLSVPELKVIERHPHSGEVYYVSKGKDAAVSYGNYDFQFTNNTGNTIKIQASNTENDVTIKLLKLE